MQMQARQTIVTPAIAQNWLKRNVGNRTVRPNHVKFLANAIKLGDFKLTHQGIAFDETGNLIDGQHRLLAIIQADLPVEMMVTRNADAESFPYVDLGARRNTTDMLRISRPVADVIRAVGRLVHGSAVTPSQLQDLYEVVGSTTEELIEHAAATPKVFGTAPMKLAAVTSILMGESRSYVMSVYRGLVTGKVDELPKVAKAMVGQMMRGTLSAGDPSDLLARGMVVFCKKSGTVGRVQVKDAVSTGERVREFYKGQLGLV